VSRGCLLFECLRGLVGSVPGVVEAVVYGSMVRGDFVPGCSDLDVFLVVSGPFLDTAWLSRLVGRCLDCSGVRVRGVDIAWCSVDEIYSHRCDYKFLTVYREDFERHSLLLYGVPVHRVQSSYWSLRGRCERLLGLAGRRVMRGIVAGETVKLLLLAHGYRGPWDKVSVLRAVSEMLDECSVRVWSSYVSCVEPPEECVDRLVVTLHLMCRGRLPF